MRTSRQILENHKPKAKCPECKKEVTDTCINPKSEELFCKHCGRWLFYGTLSSERVNGGTMKPDDVTEQLKREYDGTTDYRL